jgi:hypothetical protein
MRLAGTLAQADYYSVENAIHRLAEALMTP